MKNGKISESVLKRSVLKQLHTKSDRILFKPAVGEDCAVISMQAGGKTKLVTATQTFHLMYRISMCVLTAQFMMH